MAILRSSIDLRYGEYVANRDAMRSLVAELREKLGLARLGGGAEAQKRHCERGKMLARERIDALVDPGSPFLEIGQLAAFSLYDGAASSAGLIAGIGRVQGVECMIIANDATVKGGTYYPLTV